ncbi:MAG: hypothetical protein KGZ58_13050 [Ignavibacteriales bacterium]|nr:hypothetical protein [Ignavibacteriales bacterium]
MITKQITLTEKEEEFLEKISHERKITVEEIIRQSINSLVQQTSMTDREELKKRALSLAGKYDSGLSDVSVHHDDYLAEAYSQ